MKSNYKKLGQYITPLNERNTKNEDIPLMGLSIKKIFIPSIANTVGTDMSTYKIVKRNQFAYGPVTSRNGDKITIALFQEHDRALLSQAYIPFEITNEEELDAEYLMMWFRRPEFDRYARFKSHGSAREIFDWDEMCDVSLPIPSIEKQREIVKEYNTIVNRIVFNETINQKLEETAQALYKHWFIDFEFPDKSGKSYKSNGGAMVWNEELDKEIPEGWEVDEIGSAVESLGGGTPKTEESEYWESGKINWFSPTDITNSEYIFCFESKKKITEMGLAKSSAKLFPKKSLMMTSRATIGKIGINLTKAATNQGFITLIPNSKYKLFTLVQWLKSNLDEVELLSSGSTFKEISKTDFRRIKIYKSNKYDQFEEKLIPIYLKIETLSKQTLKLQETKEILLAKMTKI